MKRLSTKQVEEVKSIVLWAQHEYGITNGEIARGAKVTRSTFTRLFKENRIGRVRASRIINYIQYLNRSYLGLEQKIEKQVNTWSWILLTISIVTFLLTLFIIT